MANLVEFLATCHLIYCVPLLQSKVQRNLVNWRIQLKPGYPFSKQKNGLLLHCPFSIPQRKIKISKTDKTCLGWQWFEDEDSIQEL